LQCVCALISRLPHTFLTRTHALKKIMRYPRFTPEFGLWYSSIGYSYADFVGCRLERKSTSRTYQFLWTSLVSWSSRKQSNVA
jgi:hypothetical protein